jgi:NDP-sugar pyrophosphorylase family protein
MIKHAVIMAATPSRGMESITRTRPKIMLPILGKPLIAWVMEALYKADIRRFTIVVGEHEGTAIEWLMANWHSDVQLTFAPQGHRRGTASALIAARGFIEGPFIIASCDNLVPDEHIVSMTQYFESRSSDAAALTLFYAPEEALFTAGVLLGPRGNVAYISEKPFGAHQDYMTTLSLYAFTPDILSYLDRVPILEESGERALATAIQMMIDDGKLVGAVQVESRIRVDNPHDLLQANLQLLSETHAHTIKSEIPPNAQIDEPVYIDSSVVIGNGAHIGPQVYLESGTVLGSNTVVSNSVILARRISGGTTINGELVAGDR